MNPTNPFLVPGCDDPKNPLDPGVTGADSDFVDVDQTEEAYRRFKTAFGDGRRVLERGRFVLVSGPSGCGKTALINRCVQWLNSDDSPALHQHVVDVRLDLPRNASVNVRTSRTSIAVVDQLRARRALPLASAIFEHEDDPARVYRGLGAELGRNTFVTVLLPPSGDLIDELDHYARLTNAKMVVFAETSRVDVLARRLGEMEGSPLFLEVGPLRESDGDVYTGKRLGDAIGWPFAGSPPPVDRRDLIEFLRMRPVSIGELQQMLHGVYEEIIRSGSPPPSVTRDHFYRYFVKLAGEGRNE